MYGKNKTIIYILLIVYIEQFIFFIKTIKKKGVYYDHEEKDVVLLFTEKWMTSPSITFVSMRKLDIENKKRNCIVVGIVEGFDTKKAGIPDVFKSYPVLIESLQGPFKAL